MNDVPRPAYTEAAGQQSVARPLSTTWFYGFFFISGFCSLVYEVVWLRLTVAKFGVTTPMVSILLSVFMAGLGLGSWAGGAFIRRYRNANATVPLRFYGVLELLIGVSGLVVPFLLNIGYELLRHFGSNLAWGSFSFHLVCGFWVAVALLPWCTCMGATFPFAMAAIRKLDIHQATRSFSYLYLANVLGAVAGTLIPAFLLIELYGFEGTLRIAGVLNSLLALTVFIVSTRAASSIPLEQASEAPPVTPPNRSILWQLFATGLCSMAMEVVWIREFTVYLGNVVYAFALILAFYLLATFAGSALYRRWARRHPDAPAYRAWIPLGLLGLLPLLFADPRFPLAESADLFTSLGHGSLRAALGIVPFSALVGFLTPMLVDRWSRGVPDRAGRAYAVNVLGSILGPLVAGFWIVPAAGERWGLALIALPLFAIPVTSARAPRSWVPLAGSAVAALLLISFTRDYSIKFPNPIELRDHTATVIASGQGMRKRLLVNGTGMTKLTPITKMMGHLPLSFLSHHPQNGLVICMGMGTTFRSMLSWGIDATVVELVPSVPKLFSFFHPDAPQLLASGKAHIVVDDGRRFLQRSTEQFDAMAIDPPPPISAPTSSLLYSIEFYRTVKPHLKPGGILQVWCPGGDDTTNAAITKAITASFPYVRAFESLEDWGTHFIVSMQPLPNVNAALLTRNLPAAAARDLIEFNPDWTPAEMFAYVLDGEKSVPAMESLDPDTPAITDNRPINEYFLLRTFTD
jgi:predicted membrane-bound spermidine synthase